MSSEYEFDYRGVIFDKTEKDDLRIQVVQLHYEFPGIYLDATGKELSKEDSEKLIFAIHVKDLEKISKMSGVDDFDTIARIIAASRIHKKKMKKKRKFL